MIDWASGWFPCSYDSEKLNSGLIASLLPTGEIEWISHKKTIVEGSYSAKFTLKAHTQSLIYFSEIRLSFYKVITYLDLMIFVHY